MTTYSRYLYIFVAAQGRIAHGPRFAPAWPDLVLMPPECLASIMSSDFPPPALREAASKVAGLLRDRDETISVAETAAGGLISAALLATPGASKVYRGGATLYTLESRIAFGGWTRANIDNYSGPGPDLVADLARHLRHTLASTYAVAESGTAGPTAPRQSANGQP